MHFPTMVFCQTLELINSVGFHPSCIFPIVTYFLDGLQQTTGAFLIYFVFIYLLTIILTALSRVIATTSLNCEVTGFFLETS